MGELIGKAVGGIIDAIVQARQNGLSKAEAERELARKAERGELVSDELWNELGDYVKTTRDFERDGA
jgi:hypothetical protein